MRLGCTPFSGRLLFRHIVRQYSILGTALSLRRCRPALQPTGWRLGAAAASTTFVAGDYFSISHNIFCGTTAPVAPNRTVGRSVICRECCPLHFIVGTILNSTTLSACTTLSVLFSIFGSVSASLSGYTLNKVCFFKIFFRFFLK